MLESLLAVSASQLASAYPGCEADYSYCAPSDFLASDQAGSSPFTDPSGRNPIYQGEAPTYATSQQSQMLYPECDPMPGWQVNWNPPDCSGPYQGEGTDVRGLMPPAAWARAPDAHLEALSAPIVIADTTGDKAKTATTATKASPGQLALCGNAALLGMASATSALFEELLLNKADGGCWSRWTSNFKSTTTSAACSVAPAGGVVLRDHVFK